MNKHTEQCVVQGVFENDAEELFPHYDDAIISLWKSMNSSIAEYTYTHEECSVLIKYDWSPVIDILIKRRESYRNFKEDPKNAPDDWWKLSFERVDCSCNVLISGSNELSKYGWYASFFVESYMYDLFLILNIALPGSGNFLNVKVTGGRKSHSEDISLSSFYFENAWLESEKEVWPPLKSLSISAVSSWFRRVRPGFNQVPENPIERSLFALLHICRSDGGPEDVIWLFYGFESLFETRPGENFGAIFDRICLVLEPPEEFKSRLKKELRSLYNYRSSFVHGGLSVIHPHHREVMDKRVDTNYGDIVKLSLRWTHILVACLQQYADKEWNSVQFKTILVPD